MRKIVPFLGLLILTGCTAGVGLRSVDYGSLFHDNNSKVWLVNKVMVNNAVISPVNNIDKHILVFYSDHACDYISLKNIAREAPEKGYFILDSDKRTMYIEFQDDRLWDFTISYMEEDSILLEPTSKSDINLAIQLKPFQEL